MICAEAHVPYERPPLSKAFLAGDVAVDRLAMRPASFYADKKIELRLGATVASIDRAQRRIQLESGETFPYAKLVLATGGRVRRLNCPGVELSGVHYLRNLDDVLGFRDRLVPAAKLTIVGGGYIGLEIAAVAIKRGCAVTLLEMMPLVLNRVVAPEMSRFFAGVHRGAGVDLRTSAAVSGFEGAGRLERVRCADGTVIEADLAIIGIGIQPNVELAAAAGLAVQNGIIVDAFTATEDPDIFAGGDCANPPAALLGQNIRLDRCRSAGQGMPGATISAGGTYDSPWSVGQRLS